MTAYYRRFIKNYAKIAQPLFTLLAKNKKFVWNIKVESIHNELTEKLLKKPILTLPDQSFLLHTEASDMAIGYQISQLDDNNGLRSQ